MSCGAPSLPSTVEAALGAVEQCCRHVLGAKLLGANLHLSNRVYYPPLVLRREVKRLLHTARKHPKFPRYPPAIKWLYKVVKNNALDPLSSEAVFRAIVRLRKSFKNTRPSRAAATLHRGTPAYKLHPAAANAASRGALRYGPRALLRPAACLQGSAQEPDRQLRRRAVALPRLDRPRTGMASSI